MCKTCFETCISALQYNCPCGLPKGCVDSSAVDDDDDGELICSDCCENVGSCIEFWVNCDCSMEPWEESGCSGKSSGEVLSVAFPRPNTSAMKQHKSTM